MSEIRRSIQFDHHLRDKAETVEAEPRLEAVSSADETERVRQQEQDRRWGYDLIPAAESPLTYDCHPRSSFNSSSLVHSERELPPGATETLEALPWEHIPPAGSGPRAAELPKEFDQLIKTIHERAENPPGQHQRRELELIAATHEEAVRRRLIEAFHWQQECSQAETEYNHHSAHERGPALDESRQTQDQLGQNDRNTIRTFENCQSKIDKADQTEQKLEQALLEERDYLKLKHQRDNLRATRDELINPGGLGKLSLILPGRRAKANRQLFETNKQIKDLDQSITGRWGHSHPRERVTDLEQEANPLLEARPQLTVEKSQLESGYNQAIARREKAEAAKQRFDQAEQKSSELANRINTARDKIEEIKKTNKELFEDVLGRGGIGVLGRRDLDLHGRIKFDQKGDPQCEAEDLWDLPDSAPKGLKSAADYRRHCAEQLIEQGHSPDQSAERDQQALRLHPEGYQFTDNDQRLGYDLVKPEPAPLNWQNQVLPAELPPNIAVHCADLDSHAGYISQSLRALGRPS